MNYFNLGLIHLKSFARDEVLEHYSLLSNEVGFLPTQHQSFSNINLDDLYQVSQTAIKVISKDGETIHEDIETITKEVGEDGRHTYLKCRGSVT